MVVAVGSALVVLFAGASVILAVGHSVPTELWAAAGALSGALVGILAPPPPTGNLSDLEAIHTASAHTNSDAVNAAQQNAQKYMSVAEQPNADANAERAAKAAQDALEKVQRNATVADGLKLAAGGANLSQPALAAAAAAAAVADYRTAADDAVSAQKKASTAQAADPSNPEAQANLEEASASVDVLTAAATAADSSQEAAAKAGVIAAAATPQKRLRLGQVDGRIVVLLVVLVLAFAAGIWLALELGSEAADKATEYDTAIRNAADTLIALGSAAGGAIVGLMAPPPGPDRAVTPAPPAGGAS